MKRILFVLVTIISTISVLRAVEIENLTKFKEDNYIKAIAEYLEISNHALIYISETSDPIRRLNKEVELLGLAQELSDDIYIIYIDPHLSKRQSRIVLAHELVHVKQFQEGELTHLHGGSVEFRGKTYRKVDSYYSRPYEVEAMDTQYKLYRMFKHIEQMNR